MDELRTQQLKWAVNQWRKAADNDKWPPSKETSLKAAKALELELETGQPHCVCHLLTECPNNPLTFNQIPARVLKS